MRPRGFRLSKKSFFLPLTREVARASRVTEGEKP